MDIMFASLYYYYEKHHRKYRVYPLRLRKGEHFLSSDYLNESLLYALPFVLILLYGPDSYALNV